MMKNDQFNQFSRIDDLYSPKLIHKID